MRTIVRLMLVASAAAALAGCGGSGVNQLVEKDRDSVYALFEIAYRSAEHKEQSIVDGKPVEVEVKVDGKEDEWLDAVALQDGAQIGRIRLEFSEAASGKHTVVHGSVEMDQELFQKIAGNDEWTVPFKQHVLDAGLKAGLQSAAAQIEQGGAMASGNPFDAARLAAIRTEQKAYNPEADPRMRRAQAKMDQYAATQPTAEAKPMVDPNEAARAYLEQ